MINYFTEEVGQIYKAKSARNLKGLKIIKVLRARNMNRNAMTESNQNGA